MLAVPVHGQDPGKSQLERPLKACPQGRSLSCGSVLLDKLSPGPSCEQCGSVARAIVDDDYRRQPMLNVRDERLDCPLLIEARDNDRTMAEPIHG